MIATTPQIKNNINPNIKYQTKAKKKEEKVRTSVSPMKTQTHNLPNEV
jgi:hypothetical protein